MNTDETDKIDTFRRASEFSGLSEEDLAELASLAVPRVFKRGEFIFHEEDPSAFFYIVHKGRVKLFKRSPSGKQFITLLRDPSQAVNSVVLFAQRPHFVSAQAMTDTTLFRIKAEDFLSFVCKRPDQLVRIIINLQDALSSAWDRLIDAVGEDVSQRVINILRAVSNKSGDTLTLTCSEVAELSGTTTETVIRIIKKIEALDILQHTRGTIRVVDPVKLRRLSRAPFDI